MLHSCWLWLLFWSGSVQCANWSPLQAGPFPPASHSHFILAPQGHLGLRRIQREIWGSCNPGEHTLARVTVGLAIPALGSQVPGGTEETLSRAAASERRGASPRAGSPDAQAPRPDGSLGVSSRSWSLTSPLRSRDLYPESPSLASLPAPGPTLQPMHRGSCTEASQSQGFLAFQAGDALIKSRFLAVLFAWFCVQTHV